MNKSQNKKPKKAKNQNLLSKTKGKLSNPKNNILKINKKVENVLKEESLNDIEMNSLDYEIAKEKDNRSYCQYYLSLLRTRHILIFSFFQFRDYNSQMIKIYIFFFTFAINYLVSAMFYSYSTMHKIYKDEGSFDFTYQLPQMIYSLLISTALKVVLNILGLYESNIVSFRAGKYKDLNTKIEVLFKIRCKIIFFFIITYIFLAFIWIYLGCFCAVYKNTQIHLLLDVSSSFGLSFISPIFIYLLPGILRIPSLKSKSNRSFCFKISKLLQLL